MGFGMPPSRPASIPKKPEKAPAVIEDSKDAPSSPPLEHPTKVRVQRGARKPPTRTSVVIADDEAPEPTPLKEAETKSESRSKLEAVS